MNKINITGIIFAATFFTFQHCASAQGMGATDAKKNHLVNYLSGDAPVAPWIIAVGDEGNWYVPLGSDGGKSKTRKVRVSKKTDDEKGEIYRIRWSRKPRDGYLSITGDTIDLSGVKDSAALMINMKLMSEVKNSIHLSMDCQYPCEGKIDIQSLLKRQPLKEWFSLPVALNCFQKEGLDLSKINAPMKLQTNGKLEMYISEVKLIRLPKEEKGCAG